MASTILHYHLVTVRWRRNTSFPVQGIRAQWLPCRASCTGHSQMWSGPTRYDINETARQPNNSTLTHIRLILYTPTREIRIRSYILRTAYPERSLYISDKGLYDQLLHLFVTYTARESSEPVKLFDWHRQMYEDDRRNGEGGRNWNDGSKRTRGHGSARPMSKLCTHEITPPTFQEGRTRATELLQVIHGGLVGPMLVK